jgi:signal transduction histidine kinase
MRFDSLAFRLFASAAAWTLIVLPATAILLISIYSNAVERNFDARLNVYLTSLVAATTAAGGAQPTALTNQVLQALKRTLDWIYGERGLDLVVAPSAGLKFQGEKQDFEELVGNLLDNACKWARSRVRADAKSANGEARFTVIVDDDGPGWSKAELAKGVKRGQRLDESKPGSGLGLSIVAELAHLYKGRFELELSPEGGLRAKLELPAA